MNISIFNRKKSSIKNKLLLALIILPIASISFYTYLAVDMIKKDKFVQVLETSSLNSKIYSTAFNSLFDKYRLVSQILLVDVESVRSADYFQKSYPDLLNLTAYKVDSESFKMFFTTTKDIVPDTSDIEKIIFNKKQKSASGFFVSRFDDVEKSIEFVSYSEALKKLLVFKYREPSFFSGVLSKSLFSTIFIVDKFNRASVIGDLKNTIVVFTIKLPLHLPYSKPLLFLKIILCFSSKHITISRSRKRF